MGDLMLRCYTNIVIQQKANGRNLLLEFGFCKEWEGGENWTELTNKGKVTLPKNIYAIDGKTGRKFPLAGNVNKQQWITNLFQRGDTVAITTGYYRYDSNTGNETLDKSIVFNGFISKVESKQPIVLEVQDNMWLLKQIPCKPQVWPKNKTVEELMKQLLQGTNLTVNALTETYLGDLIIQDESVAQLLDRLRKHYHLEAYFGTPAGAEGTDKHGTELRIGSLVYIPPSPAPKSVYTFVFQKNIVSDELSYQRKDDIKLSAVCESLNTVFTGHTNKKGEKKTKQERTQVLVWSDVKGNWKYRVKKKGVDFPANEEGERRSLFFPNVTDAAKLAQMGVNELAKYYYEGFKGSFTTFAIPDISIGDYIKLEDEVLPDRNGFYVVKGVEKSGGINGGRQRIELAYKLVTVGGTLKDPVFIQKPVLG